MKPCTCRIVSGGEFDEQLVEQCDACAELDAREKLETEVEDDPNWKEKEELPDIPVLQPITLQVRQLNPEAWK